MTRGEVVRYVKRKLLEAFSQVETLPGEVQAASDVVKIKAVLKDIRKFIEEYK